jgi:hypothetical protein
MQTNPHGARRGAERSSDLFAGASVDVKEKDGVALSGRQQLDGSCTSLERLAFQCVRRGRSRGENPPSVAARRSHARTRRLAPADGLGEAARDEVTRRPRDRDRAAEGAAVLGHVSGPGGHRWTCPPIWHAIACSCPPRARRARLRRGRRPGPCCSRPRLRPECEVSPPVSRPHVEGAARVNCDSRRSPRRDRVAVHTVRTASDRSWSAGRTGRSRLRWR